MSSPSLVDTRFTSCPVEEEDQVHTSNLLEGDGVVGVGPGHMRSPVEGENLVHMSSPVGVAPLKRAALALKRCMGWSGEESFIA